MIALHNLKYRISLLFITAIIFIIALLPIGGGNIALAQISIKYAYEDSNVLDDLLSSKDFKLSDYPYDENISARCINFSEFCYSINKADRKDFGLYLYIYNPSGKQVKDSGMNKAQLAVSYEDGKPNKYDKFTLKLCSYSTGEHAYKFYKFRIIDHVGEDGLKIEDRVNAESRRYDISGLELLHKGDNNATDYTVGGSYIFTGFAAGYGADKTAASTLKCSVKDIEYIRITGLQDRQTVYRTDMSNPNMTSHNQINSVYFSIPNEILNKYKKLQKVECEWWEYRTEPILVTNNQDLYNAMMSARGKNIGEHNCDYDYGIAIYKEGTLNGNIKRYSWGFNMFTYSSLNGNGLYVNSVCPCINWIFATKTWGQSLNNYTVESDELITYMNGYSGQLSESDNGYQYRTDLFNKNVGEKRVGGYNRKNIDVDEDAFDFTQYNPTYTGWDALKHAFGWNTSTEAALTGQAPIICIDSDNVSEKLAGNNSDIAARLFIGENDANKFKSYCNSEISQNNTVVLLRFACTEYTANPLDVFKYAEHTAHIAKISKDTAFVAQENVFLNFDIMTLTFNDDGKYMVIPVVMSPIDIISDIYGPATDTNNTPYWLIVVMLLGVSIAAIIATIIAYKMVYFALDAITDLFTPSYSHRSRRR